MYITHYGRHGSRYLVNPGQYAAVNSILEKAAADSMLTPEGQRIWQTYSDVYPLLDKREGELTPLGAMQHRGIARRMVGRYPSLFKKNARIEANSTNLERTMLSMFYFTRELLSLRPGLDIHADASRSYMGVINQHTLENPRATEYDVQWKKGDGLWRPAFDAYVADIIDPEPFCKRLFADYDYLRGLCDPLDFERTFFDVAMNFPSCGFPNILDAFTSDELLLLGRLDNCSFYIGKSRFPGGDKRGCYLSEAVLGDIIDRVENLKELLSEAKEYDKAHRAEPVDMESLELDDGDGMPVEVDDDFFFDTATADTTAGILSLYLENASLFTEGDDYNEDDDFVKLMSIHSAKGLEFGAVFIIGLEEGVFPSYRSVQSMEDTEEERRLMYVAITRAKKNLFIVLSRQRMLFGQTNCNQPSRFIKEIDPELLYLMGSRREAPKDVPQGETSREKSKKSISSAIRSQFTGNKDGSAPARKEGLGPDDLTEGMRVVHPRFGEGVILKVEPVGGDALITVDFDGMRKNMLANAAGLKKA